MFSLKRFEFIRCGIILILRMEESSIIQKDQWQPGLSSIFITKSLTLPSNHFGVSDTFLQLLYQHIAIMTHLVFVIEWKIIFQEWKLVVSQKIDLSIGVNIPTKTWTCDMAWTWHKHIDATIFKKCRTWYAWERLLLINLPVLFYMLPFIGL